ncbi:hypothetical protein J5N97_021165 [Dioscorea zingiberensis]|uniref:Uncharacterized protein n=1 Tax=Dioscorea zingiberensis TaxID=325984 RepID=A0A9D5CH46_9LILI|nr:hypothetical protein J5N97_021165 [Dioscorea zingiberensis]
MAASDPMLRLEGKVAIITGAASGIGEATARLFAAHGARVVIADVQDELGEAVAASIGLQTCSYKHCDVTDEKQVEETVGFTLEKYGSLDIMHSNAGVAGPVEGVMDLDLNKLDRTLAVNVRGTAAAVKHARVDYMHGKRRGAAGWWAVATPLLLCGLDGVTTEEVEDQCGEMATLKGVVLKAGNVAQGALFLASDASSISVAMTWSLMAAALWP